MSLLKNKWFLIGLLSAVLLTLVYTNHFNNPYQFDDVHTIKKNPAIEGLENIPSFFSDAATFSTLPTHQTYRPMVSTIIAFSYWLGGNELNPFYLHLCIYIFYVLQLVLMYFMILKIANHVIENQNNKWYALLTTIFYGFHMANAETINYMISVGDSFSTLMVIAAFVVYMYGKGWKKALFLLPFILGILTKRTALMFVPIFLVYSLLFEMELSLKELFSKKFFNAGIRKLKYVAIVILVGIVGYKFVGSMTSSEFTPGGSSPYLYFITQPFVLLSYVKTFFIPNDLSADTDWGLLDGISDFRAIVGFLFIIGLVYLAFMLSTKNKWKPIAFGIAWFLFALVPTSSIIPLAEVKNDHRIFFPYVGLAMAFGWLVYIQITERKEFVMNTPIIKRGLVGVFLLIIGLHANGIRERNSVWSTEESLWKDVTVKSPENGRGWMNYGLTKMGKGEFQEALDCFNKSKKYNPNYDLLYINLAIVKASMGTPDAEIEALYKQALNLRPKYEPTSLYWYAYWLYQKNRGKEGISYLKQALVENPKYLEAHELLMNSYNQSRNFVELKKQAASTLAIFPNNLAAQRYLNVDQSASQAMVVLPVNPTEHDYLGASLDYYNSGQYEKCIHMCDSAISINPEFAPAWNNKCTANNQLGRWQDAIQAGLRATELDPNFQLAKNNLAYAFQQLQIAQKEAMNNMPDSLKNL